MLETRLCIIKYDLFIKLWRLRFSAYRRSVIAGALIGVILIQAAASIGAEFAAGEMGIIRNGFERFGTDVFFVVAAGLIVFWLKQVLVHRRKPLV